MKNSYYKKFSATAETQLQENIYFAETDDNSIDDFINAECYNCNIKFAFNNQLHSHLIQCNSFTLQVFIINQHIIIFKHNHQIESNQLLRFGFCHWQYITAHAYVTDFIRLVSICLDSECIMTLISRKFLQAQNSIIFIQSTCSISIQNIEKAESITEFMNFKLHFSVFLNEKLIIAQIQVEAHVMNNLKANFLLSIDNMTFKDIILDLFQK